MSCFTVAGFHRAMAIFVLLLLASIAHGAENRSIQSSSDWGIEPTHVRITANGYMIEFRYRVIDIEKALILSDRKHFPQMLALKSNAKLSVPYGRTVGFLKSNRRFLKPGRQYIAMFSNEGKHLLPGDEVKIQVKDEVSETFVLE